MAKGNLFLGTSRNSVGDVVMYRRDGAQVSRVRVRKVANPKTAAQCLQRSAFSPAAKFYAPLAVTLAKSWEGLSKAKSYAAFLKQAVTDARANSWLLKKGTAFFPLPYKLSQGTVQPTFGEFDHDHHRLKVTNVQLGETYQTIGQVSAAFIAAGYKPGDVVTFIGANSSRVTDDAVFIPMVDQFVISADSTATVNDVIKSFELYEDNGILTIASLFNNLVAGAVIVSRWENEKWRRSTQSLICDEAIYDIVQDQEFIQDAIASYGATDADGNPMVYLDGENA